MAKLTTLGLSSMLMSIENNREKENYFKNKIEPSLSLRDRHEIHQAYKENNYDDLSPSELYAKGLLKKGIDGWYITKQE